MAGIPPSPSSGDKAGSHSYKPYEIDPDLAASHLAEEMMTRMGTPGIVSKPFVVWQGIWEGLNHTEKNETYYDSSIRCSIYRGVFNNSVNINGSLFERFWQYMMKPKMVVQGLPGQQTFEQDDNPSLWDRTFGRLLGGKKEDTNNGSN
jgi:hypothetical protein